MASNASAPVLPNPNTPLAFLPPDIANQLAVVTYILSAVIGAFMWDFLSALPEDFMLLFRSRFVLSDLIYILSRCLSCAFILCSLILSTGPVGNCKHLAISLGWCFGLGMPFNSLLFFFRVRAVFHNEPRVVYLFFFLWLLTLTCISSPFAVVDAVHVGTSKTCIETDIKAYGPIGIVFTAFYDTLVYLAISIKLTTNSLADKPTTWREFFDIFFRGRGMGGVSRVLLTSGQSYYLITVGVNIVSMALIFSPYFPSAVKVAPANIDIALQNAMACRVYRHLKLGLISESTTHSWYNSSGRSPRPLGPASVGGGVPLSTLQFGANAKCPRCQCVTVDSNMILGPTMTTGDARTDVDVDVEVGVRSEVIKLGTESTYGRGTDEDLDRKEVSL